MKQVFKSILYLLGIFIVVVICWVPVFYIWKSFWWLVRKLNVFLIESCVNLNLDLSDTILQALSFGIVTTIILMILGALIYIFFYKKSFNNID